MVVLFSPKKTKQTPTDSPSQFKQFSCHVRMFVLCQRSVNATSQYPKTNIKFMILFP